MNANRTSHGNGTREWTKNTLGCVLVRHFGGGTFVRSIDVSPLHSVVPECRQVH